MIRRLTAQDHEAVMALVQPKAAENVFLNMHESRLLRVNVRHSIKLGVHI